MVLCLVTLTDLQTLCAGLSASAELLIRFVFETALAVDSRRTVFNSFLEQTTTWIYII